MRAWLLIVVAGQRSIHFGDQAINVNKQACTAGMRASSDDSLCTLGKSFLASEPGPTPDIAIGNCRNPPQVVDPARMPKISEKILEAKPKVARELRHVAVQHDAFV